MSPTYDRQLLLVGAKRNAVLELGEVQRYGTESYRDADYVPCDHRTAARGSCGTLGRRKVSG
jgi:hypothetical protein